MSFILCVFSPPIISVLSTPASTKSAADVVAIVAVAVVIGFVAVAAVVVCFVAAFVVGFVADVVVGFVAVVAIAVGFVSKCLNCFFWVYFGCCWFSFVYRTLKARSLRYQIKNMKNIISQLMNIPCISRSMINSSSDIEFFICIVSEYAQGSNHLLTDHLFIWSEDY